VCGSPRKGMTAPGRIRDGGATSARAASIQARWPDAHSRAFVLDTRLGTVRTTAPVRGSTRSRITLARGETFRVSGAVVVPPEKLSLELTIDQVMLVVAGLILADRPAAN